MNIIEDTRILECQIAWHSLPSNGRRFLIFFILEEEGGTPGIHNAAAQINISEDLNPTSDLLHDVLMYRHSCCHLSLILHILFKHNVQATEHTICY